MIRMFRINIDYIFSGNMNVVGLKKVKERKVVFYFVDIIFYI